MFSVNETQINKSCHCLTGIQHLSALIRQEVCQKNFKELINFKDKGAPLTVESLQYLFIPVEIWMFGNSKYLGPAQSFYSHFGHETCFVTAWWWMDRCVISVSQNEK